MIEKLEALILPPYKIGIWDVGDQKKKWDEWTLRRIISSDFNT